MKTSEFIVLQELNYPGNIGMMEMAKFYQVATEEEKALMKSLLAQKKNAEAWELLQQVSKMTLQKQS